VRPRALRPGDRVGVCAPCGPVAAERLAEGVSALEALGFVVQVPDGVYARELFMAGSIERRTQELHELFEDPGIAGVLCARGGAGLLQLMDALDLGRLLAHPKVLLGYSDITPLHVALNQRGLVTFHGPMVARDFAEAGLVDRASLMSAVMGEGRPYQSAAGELQPLRSGQAEGVLLGGCLSLLAALVGTPWALRPGEDALLFLEDWDEPPYRIDRLLWQLRASGTFERVRGVVLGEFLGCETAPQAQYRLVEVLRHSLRGLELPIALGLKSGHVSSGNITLPLGVRARLACDDTTASFALLEESVR